MSPTQSLVAAIIVALAGLVGSYLTTRQNRNQGRATNAQQIIDQVQEERNRAEDRADKAEARFDAAIAQVKAELAEVRAELVRVNAREQVLVEHAWQLRRHINEQLAPPPPPWPDDLQR